MNYILASASPRRRELLAKCGIYFDIIPSGIEEKITGEAPPDIVMELARQKAMDVWKNHAKNGDVVILSLIHIFQDLLFIFLKHLFSLRNRC